jgi:hypothetical protein
MINHLTVRLAWHNDGWNGRICEKPEENTYCVGCSSYPGDAIREQRDLSWEKSVAGQPIAGLDRLPACMYSASAFSEFESELIAEPPAFFKDDTEIARWAIPPSTACTWPYEAMYYKPDIKTAQGRFDYDKRLAYAEEHFDALTNDVSLVFYYANYSNPLSDEESPKYVFVGVSRLKSTGVTQYYPNCSPETIERYKGFVWQRNVTSHYPEQGLRLPYHVYLDEPEKLEQFAVIPEANHLCKYASKQVSDDQAIGLIEQLLQSVLTLKHDLKDKTENWDARIQWLQSIISELWQSRGAYPGMPSVLEFLNVHDAIQPFKQMVLAGKEQEAVQQVQQLLSGTGKGVGEWTVTPQQAKSISRQVLLATNGQLDLLIDVLARCALTRTQIEKIMGERRDEWGITAELNEILDNPYLLSEQFIVGDDEDPISWAMVDRCVIPSPELGSDNLLEKGSEQRVRSLILDQVRRNTPHTFISSTSLVKQLEYRIEVQPEWKRSAISKTHLIADKDFLQEALYLRDEEGETYIYDRLVWEDERLVSDSLKDLLRLTDIRLKSPVTGAFWHNALFQDGSALAENARDEYTKAVEGQQNACARIIVKHLAILDGGAGTGKSTVVSALIKAIQKDGNHRSGIAILAPTGKATDRLRSMLDQQDDMESVQTATIHSLLAKHGWLNKNMSFKRAGGKPIDGVANIIIDESSMIDLNLMASLFRAIDWNAVKRLLLVGDTAQLPPIGIGKAFADLTEYILEHYPEHIASLKDNLRQLNNKAQGKGTGILDLANCFRNNVANHSQESTDNKFEREELLQRVHEGQVSNDLDVEFWSDPEQLSQQIIEKITNDLRAEGNDESAEKVWNNCLKKDINAFQILSPVRAELYGVDHINLECQKFNNKSWLEKGSVNGITMFDKVIQICNRPASRPINAYNFNTRSREKVEIYNGEIGQIVPQYWPKNGWQWKNLAIKDLCGQFANKSHLKIEYFGGGNAPEHNLELGYAISVHKSQGSEFKRVYLVLPKVSPSRQLMELLYTGITRASEHCTIFIQDSVETLLSHIRPERSSLACINTSLFEFGAVPEELLNRSDWYEEGKVHRTLTEHMVRSKSEVIIANMLHQYDLSFEYETPLYGKDGTFHLPDFTVTWKGDTFYWEHLGMPDVPEYKEKWQKKQKWYEDNGFTEQLITTKDDGGNLDSKLIEKAINQKIFGIDEEEQRKTWDEIESLIDCEYTLDFIKHARNSSIELPVWGFDVLSNEEIIGDVEFAWPEYKVALYIDEAQEVSAEYLEGDDWTVFGVTDLPAKKLVKVLNAYVSES